MVMMATKSFRSYYNEQDPPPSEERMSVAPMDTTLAGIGERQFSTSSNELDDPVSTISLTPDQESNTWACFDPLTQDLTMEMDQPIPDGSVLDYDFGDVSLPGHNQRAATSGTLDRRAPLQTIGTLSDIATSQSSADKVVQPSPLLSSAPQTKAEQQRQALQKLSKIIVRACQDASRNNSCGEAEDVVLRVLGSKFRGEEPLVSQQPSTQASSQGSSVLQEDSGYTGADMLTKQEALQATQALSKAIRQVPNVPRRRTGSSQATMLKCDQCPVTVARACDMRKHMKRHTRPYGCTYPKCHKRFGAKSDWKRHENSQHFQLESYRCSLPSPILQTPCGELFFKPKFFEAHLREEHKMSDEEQVAHEVKCRRIGRNGSWGFWCGFCREVVELKKKRNAAWDERFDHIDKHFGKGERIEDWLCVEAKKTKGDVLKEMDNDSFDDEDTEGLSPEDDQPSPNDMQQGTDEGIGEGLISVPPADISFPSSNLGKRRADDDSCIPPAKRSKRETWTWLCVSPGPVRCQKR